MANIGRSVLQVISGMSWSKTVTALTFSLLSTRLPPVKDLSSLGQLLAAAAVFVLLASGVELLDRRFPRR